MSGSSGHHHVEAIRESKGKERPEIISLGQTQKSTHSAALNNNNDHCPQIK
jgi:hypothetical protein